MIAVVWKISKKGFNYETVYFKPLNFDDWNPKGDFFARDSMRASKIRIISEDEAMVRLI